MSSSSTELMTDVTMPQMGVSVAEGTIVAWRVEVGDRIEADATICEITTDKIDTEVPAPVSGVVAEILVPVGETVAVGTVVARIGGGGAGVVADPRVVADAGSVADAGAGPATGNGGAPPSPTAAPGLAGRPARYSPVVQRIAAEHGVDLAQVRGTGRGGRVRKQDVLAVVESGPEPPLHIESPYV
ncbi:MAG: E3 binding domain-containing protein, partial [Solirubrobacterales bacterium]|nr:E3 binding domain-containing protein [Solirubrobacterales bacterium]